jgi:hypothetical protein
MLTQMAFVTTLTIAWAHWTHVAFATAPVKFTPADVLTFPQAIVIVTATSSTPVVSVEVQVSMRMQMASVTTRIHASVNSTNVVCAMVTAVLAPTRVQLLVSPLHTR